VKATGSFNPFPQPCRRFSPPSPAALLLKVNCEFLARNITRVNAASAVKPLGVVISSRRTRRPHMTFFRRIRLLVELLAISAFMTQREQLRMSFDTQIPLTIADTF
jgi:hypothetical protein